MLNIEIIGLLTNFKTFTFCTGDFTPRHKVTQLRVTFTRHEAAISVGWIVTSVNTVPPRVSRWTFCIIGYNKETIFKRLAYLID